MPQVPYTGAPQGGPENVPLKPDVPGALLEGTRAIEGFGRDITGAGDKLWNRAVQLKQDQNESEAIEADSQYMVEAGKLRADYDTKQGDDRVKAYPDYQKALVETRQKIRAGLSNDDARRRYDFSSLRTQAYSITNGASAAATAAKDRDIQTTTANVGITKQEYADNPTQSNLDKIEAGARRQAELRHGGGEKSVIADDYARKDISDAILKRIANVAKNHADQAALIMRREEKRLTPEDRNSANNLVTAQATSQGAELITRDVAEWGKETADKPAKSLDEQYAEAERRVKEMDPNGDLPNLLKQTRANISTNFNQGNHARVVQKQTDQSTLADIITTNNPLSLSQLMQDPKAYDILSKAGPDQARLRLYAQGVINSWYKTKDQAEKSENFKQLYSMSSSNTEEFMNTPPSDWKVSKGDWKILMQKRATILKGGAVNDPRVDTAMKWLQDSYGQTMDDLHITGKKKDIASYHLFRGSLAVALDNWQAQNPGQKITADSVKKEIWPQLRAEESERRTALKDVFGTGIDIPGINPFSGLTGGGWFTKTVPNWARQVPNDPAVREELKRKILEKRPDGAYTPSEEELRNEMLENMWPIFNTKPKASQ